MPVEEPSTASQADSGYIGTSEQVVSTAEVGEHRVLGPNDEIAIWFFLRLISAEPVGGLVHDPASNHRHERFDVANVDFLHGQWIGTQYGEVREFARL